MLRRHGLTQHERLVELLGDGNVWRMDELRCLGITGATVGRAVRSGVVERLAHGTYRGSGAPEEGRSDLALVASRMPGGVVCLASAASIHGLGDLCPNEVWLAIPQHHKPPRLEWPVVRPVFWRSPASLTLGVETLCFSGVPVKVTDPVRTTADMFRMLSTVGEERALEVLRDYVGAGGSIPAVRAMLQRLGAGSSAAAYLLAFDYMAVRRN